MTPPTVSEKQGCFSETPCWNYRFSDCSRTPENQAPQYHAKLSFYLVVSKSTVLQRAKNTMKNTIDDADDIICWIDLIVIHQCIRNSRHSQPIVTCVESIATQGVASVKTELTSRLQLFLFNCSITIS